MSNVGTLDRIVRVLVGVLLLVLGFGGFVTGTAGLVLKVVGFVPLATALIGFCPLYLPLRLSTKARP